MLASMAIGSCTTPCDEGCTFCTAAEDEPGPKYIWQDSNPIRCELETMSQMSMHELLSPSVPPEPPQAMSHTSPSILTSCHMCDKQGKDNILNLSLPGVLASSHWTSSAAARRGLAWPPSWTSCPGPWFVTLLHNDELYYIQLHLNVEYISNYIF